MAIALVSNGKASNKNGRAKRSDWDSTMPYHREKKGYGFPMIADLHVEPASSNHIGQIRSLNEYYSTMPWEWCQLRFANSDDLVPAHVFSLLSVDATAEQGYALQANIALRREANRYALSPETISSFRSNHVYGLVTEYVLSLNHDEVRRLVDFGMRYGALQQAEYLIEEFRSTCRTLFDTYDFNEDGVVDCNRPLEELHWDLAARFNDIVISGRRCVDRMEELIKKLIGEASEYYKSWKELSGEIYDKNLSYAFCYQVINSIKHGFALISIVNVGISERKLGLAINLDAGLLERDGICTKDGIQNAGLRRRLQEFRDARIRSGQTPWLSMGSTLCGFIACIEVLYMNFLEAYVNYLAGENFTLPCIGTETEGINCLVWRCGDGNKLSNSGCVYHQDRLYTFAPHDYLPELKMEARTSVEALSKQEHLNQSELDRLIAKIDSWGHQV